MELVDELGYNVLTGERDPRYKRWYIGFVNPGDLTAGTFVHARTQAEAIRRALKGQPKGTVVDMIEPPGTGYTINLEPSRKDTMVANYRDWEGIDIEASCAALDAEVERRIRESFPDATIHWIDAYDRTRNLRPGVWDSETSDGTTTTDDIWTECQDIAIAVFNDGNLWMRGKNT